MEFMRFAVIDDEKIVLDKIDSYLKKYAEENGQKFDVTLYDDGLNLLINYKKGDYDVLFLDIQMVHSNGMEIAKSIRERDENVVLVFITNMVQYAVQGYSVEALDFIVKPLDYSLFAKKMARIVLAAERVMAEREESVLPLYFRGTMNQVKVSEITYVEVSGHCVLVHTIGETIEVWNSSMKKMEESLSKYDFHRCNACYLVNLKYVSKVDGASLVLRNERLAISKQKRKDFLNALTEYIGRKA